MTSGIDGFGPKVIWRFKLRHHSSCHINKCPVLPLRYTIFLRGVRSGILMPNTLITQEFIHSVVLELRPIISPNSQDLCIILALHFRSPINEVTLGFTLLLDIENPCVSCIIINNYQAIFLSTKTIICRRPKQIQMNELEGPC